MDVFPSWMDGRRDRWMDDVLKNPSNNRITKRCQEFSEMYPTITETLSRIFDQKNLLSTHLFTITIKQSTTTVIVCHSPQPILNMAWLLTMINCCQPSGYRFQPDYQRRSTVIKPLLAQSLLINIQPNPTVQHCNINMRLLQSQRFNIEKPDDSVSTDRVIISSHCPD